MKLPSLLSTALLALPLTAAQMQPCSHAQPCDDTELVNLDSTSCAAYHIFASRGSDSPYPGHMGGLIKLICAGLDDCNYESVEYPANSSWAGKDAWCQSCHKGAVAAQNQMKGYSEKCPKSKLIVLGFSQGGSVALDSLGGGGGDVFECTQESNPALDPTMKPGSNVVAALIFGAVVRTANQPYTVKGGKNYNGTSPRSPEHLKGLEPYAPLLQEWCNIGDPICAVGSEPQDTVQHLNYFELYNEEAAEFAIKTARRNGKKLDDGETVASGTGSQTSMQSGTVQGAGVVGLAGGWAGLRGSVAVYGAFIAVVVVFV